MKTWQLYFIVAATYASQSVEPWLANIFAAVWAVLALMHWFGEREKTND